MTKKERNYFIIERYKEDDRMMVLVFAQWCVNESLDPLVLYREAYPNQPDNDLLINAIEDTASPKQAEKISHESIMQLLHMFGNDDLAYVVQAAYISRTEQK